MLFDFCEPYLSVIDTQLLLKLKRPRPTKVYNLMKNIVTEMNTPDLSINVFLNVIKQLNLLG